MKENTVQVIIQMLFCSLQSECMECVTSGRKAPINAIEMWWSLSGARSESDILACHPLQPLHSLLLVRLCLKLCLENMVTKSSSICHDNHSGSHLLSPDMCSKHFICINSFNLPCNMRGTSVSPSLFRKWSH